MRHEAVDLAIQQAAIQHAAIRPAVPQQEVVRHEALQQAAVVRTRLRLTRRGRLALTLVLAVPVALGVTVLTIGSGQAVASQSGGEASFSYVTVQAGQSLWQLAEGLAPGSDPRDVIAEIVSLNRLDSSVVEVGTRIALPLKYSSALDTIGR